MVVAVRRSKPVSITLLCIALAACLAVLQACAEPETGGEDATVEVVKLAGKPFRLDLALTDETRFKGLSGRTEIPEDGGLLFVFADSDVTPQSFVMRDCPIPIDIIYLDRSARIVAMHEMTAEPPRTEEEKVMTVVPGNPDWTKQNAAYERRLKKYPSKYASQFVIELKGGTLKTLGLKEGQKIEIDTLALKKRAE